MNNPKNYQNHKIEGVFESEMAADNFIHKMKKLYDALPPTTNNISCTKRQATEDKKTANGHIKETDWIVTIEGQKRDLDDIHAKITEHGRFCL